MLGQDLLIVCDATYRGSATYVYFEPESGSAHWLTRD